jgi:hypothetical protein
VRAGEFLIFVIDVKIFQMLVKFLVLFEQKIIGAAVDPERGDAAVVDPLDDGERVLEPPPRAASG